MEKKVAHRHTQLSCVTIMYCMLNLMSSIQTFVITFLAYQKVQRHILVDKILQSTTKPPKITST